MEPKRKLPPGYFFIGESVVIDNTINQNTADEATITIKNPNNTKVVDADDMTKITNKVYQYIYDSATDAVAGEYLITMTFLLSGHKSIFQERFVLVDPETYNDR